MDFLPLQVVFQEADLATGGLGTDGCFLVNPVGFLSCGPGFMGWFVTMPLRGKTLTKRVD